MSLRASFVSFVLRRTIKKQMATFDDPAEVRDQANRPSGKVPAEVVRDVVDANGVTAEWVSWPGCERDKVLLYFHGGGYVFGGPDSHRNIAWRLSREVGVRVLVVDYRLAPENVFPAAVEDATASYRWLLDQGIEAERIAVAGDSAGGGLAVSLMVNLKNLGLPLPKVAALLSPWVDLAMTGESAERNAEADAMISPAAITKFATAYLGESDPKAPLASPIYADLAGLPPTYVVVGSTEVLLSDSETLVEKIKSAGGQADIKIWPKMPHVFPILAGTIPEAGKAIEDIGEFVRGELGTTSLS